MIRIDPKTHVVYYGDKPGRCSSAEYRFMQLHHELTPQQIRDVMLSPIGPIIVGEMPGPNTSQYMPLFPWPMSSAGGRLLKFSGMTAFDYLRTFHRVNLIHEYFASWDKDLARSCAANIMMAFPGHPLVLLGQRVREAFGSPDACRTLHGCLVMPIPHPSGLNRLTNALTVQDSIRSSLWDAADWWKSPWQMERNVCVSCERLVSAHKAHPGNPNYRVLCPGSPVAVAPARHTATFR